MRNLDHVKSINFPHLKDDYKVHMFSFNRKIQSSASTVAFASGDNLQLWMLELIEEWCVEVRGKL